MIHIITGLIILSIALIILSVILYNERLKTEKENSDLKKENSDLKLDVENQKIDYVFVPGARALIKNYSLTATVKSKKEDFKVDYEVDIVEVSKNDIKVNAYDFAFHSNGYASDVKNKQGIIDYMQNKWHPKKDAQLILSDSQVRDIKLNAIL